MDNQYTHYCADPQYKERAVAFKAFRCSMCGQLHRSVKVEPTVMPWILANWYRNLTQISDIPPTMEEVHGILETDHTVGVRDEST